MIRLFLFALLVLGTAVAAAWMADHPGQVSIEFDQWQIDSSFAFLGLVVLALMAGAALLLWGVGYLSREMPIFGTNRQIKRQSRGLMLLNRSMIALSTGDAKLARQLVEEAEVLLPPQPMVTMIAAEAATRLGDNAEAARRFENLRESEDGKLLGLRGLTQQATAKGQSAEALLLAREALSASKDNPWALRTIFDLEVASADWTSALTTLKKLTKAGALDEDRLLHHRAALHYALGVDARLKGDSDGAKKAFQEAVKERPTFTEGQVALARLYQGEGHKKQAKKQLIAAWKARPHRAVVEALLAQMPTATPHESLMAVRELAAVNPAHPLTKICLAEALSKEGQSEAAEKMMAEVRDHMGLDFHEVVPDDSSFQCLHCGHRQEHWTLSCDSCDSFNSLRWFDAFDKELTTLSVTKEKPRQHSLLLAD